MRRPRRHGLRGTRSRRARLGVPVPDGGRHRVDERVGKPLLFEGAEAAAERVEQVLWQGLAATWHVERPGRDVS
ncbi:hypothetical protein GT354_15945 [Streptomyces sp. SID3343]|nr:hypothetical protein [Streptomyces sp. SID3343]